MGQTVTLCWRLERGPGAPPGASSEPLHYEVSPPPLSPVPTPCLCLRSIDLLPWRVMSPQRTLVLLSRASIRCKFLHASVAVCRSHGRSGTRSPKDERPEDRWWPGNAKWARIHPPLHTRSSKGPAAVAHRSRVSVL